MTDKQKILSELPDEQLICYCSRVSKGTIKQAIIDGASSVKELQDKTAAGVGTRCKELNPSGGCCHSDLRTLIEIYAKSGSEDGVQTCDCKCNCNK